MKSPPHPYLPTPNIYFSPSSLHFRPDFSLLLTFLDHFSLLPILFLSPPTSTVNFTFCRIKLLRHTFCLILPLDGMLSTTATCNTPPLQFCQVFQTFLVVHFVLLTGERHCKSFTGTTETIFKSYG